jgi:hypothetical protein
MVIDKPEDYKSFQIPKNIPVLENNKEEIKPIISNEELDIWKQISEDFDNTDFEKKDKERLFIWLKEKLSGISFCQAYLTDKLDGENGIAKESATLLLESENGSKFFLNKAGKYHNNDAPAIEWFYGAKEYFKNGIRHRIGGAAYENYDEKQYWFEGKQYNETEYWKISNEITSLK